jgi:hypothetical protein
MYTRRHSHSAYYYYPMRYIAMRVNVLSSLLLLLLLQDRQASMNPAYPARLASGQISRNAITRVYACSFRID